MTFLIFFICLLMFSFTLASYIVNAPNYKYYKEEYYRLSTHSFRSSIDGSMIYDGTVAGPGYFLNSNSVQINDVAYFHNSPWTYLDLYALYWYLKYKKWYKANFPEAFK